MESLDSRAVSSSVPVPDPESRRTMATSMDTIPSDKLHRRLINVELLMVKKLHGLSFRAGAGARARAREDSARKPTVDSKGKTSLSPAQENLHLLRFRWATRHSVTARSSWRPRVKSAILMTLVSKRLPPSGSKVHDPSLPSPLAGL